MKHNKFRGTHSCQLLIHLLERIILMSTDEGDIVLDPFNGTGTTALAAKRLGRRYIGFDLDEQYVKITQQKLKQEKPISKIGNRWVSFYLDEVVTLRNVDWGYLKDFYYIPNNPEEIDTTPIVLKTKVRIQTPLKSLATPYGNGKHDHQTTLFEPTVHYGLNGHKRKAAHNKGLAKARVTTVKKRKRSK